MNQKRINSIVTSNPSSCKECGKPIVEGDIAYFMNTTSKYRFCVRDCIKEYYTIKCTSCGKVVGERKSGIQAPRFCEEKC